MYQIFSNTIWPALGQVHIPWGSVLTHLVTLKVFAWLSKKSVIFDGMTMSTSWNIKKPFIIYIWGYAIDTDLLSTFIYKGCQSLLGSPYFIDPDLNNSVLSGQTWLRPNASGCGSSVVLPLFS